LVVQVAAVPGVAAIVKAIRGREHHAELSDRRTQVSGGQESRQYHEPVGTPGSQDLRFIHYRTLHQQPPSPHLLSASGCAEVSTDQQDVVVGVYGGHHPCRGRAKRPCSVDLLTPGILVRGTVGARPEAVRGAGGATVHIASEDDSAGRRAAGKDRPELTALRLILSRLNGLVCGK